MKEHFEKTFEVDYNIYHLSTFLEYVAEMFESCGCQKYSRELWNMRDNMLIEAGFKVNDTIDFNDYEILKIKRVYDIDKEYIDLYLSQRDENDIEKVFDDE